MAATTTPTANRQGRSTATAVESEFVAAMQRRFRTIRGLVRSTVGYDNDALDLSANAEPRERFDFPTDRGKVEQFRRWLRQALREEVLEPMPPEDVRDGKHWMAVYLKAAFVRGVNQSTGLLFQQGASVENIPDDEILNRPVFRRTLEQVYTRAYENLESITEEAAPQVSEVLARGLAEGWNPRKMARELSGELRTIQRTRLETLARSETIHSHSEATLDNYERAGVDTVSHGEWQMTLDDDTCAFCRRLSGADLTLDEMRSGAVEFRGQVYRLQPPSHPNGRCVILPSVGGEPPTSPLAERVPGTIIAGA